MKTEFYKYRIGDGVRLFAALSALADLEEKVLSTSKSKQAVAGINDIDPDSIVKKISALRTQFKNQSLQVKYESQQKLASLLREIAHVLTDEIHAMSVCGDNTDAMKKLQAQIFKVTDSLSFVGDDDSDRNGIRDDASEEDLELGAGKSTKQSSHDAFLNAVKSLRTDNVDSTKDDADDAGGADDSDDGNTDEKPKKKLSGKDADKEETSKKLGKKKSKILSDSDEDSESGDEDNEKDDEEAGDKESKKKKGKGGGFVDGLLAESSASIAVAGLRFVYLGVKKVRKDKKIFEVIAAGFGVHGKSKMKVYYYKPTDKFFKGDVSKVDTAFKKLLGTPGGYSLLSTELNARVKSGHLEVVFNKEESAKDVLGEAPSWSFRGIGEHPTKPNRKALFFEIGNKLFAAVPSKEFENGDIDEAANYIRLKIVGSKKEGAPGLSYNDGLAKLQKLAESKKLKIIFQSHV